MLFCHPEEIALVYVVQDGLPPHLHFSQWKVRKEKVEGSGVLDTTEKLHTLFLINHVSSLCCKKPGK